MKKSILALSCLITICSFAQTTPVCYKNNTNQQALAAVSRRVITLNVNNDSFMDFAVANNTTGNVSVYIGNGSAFATMTNTIITHSPYGLASGDFNGDGSVDLLVANGSTNTASLRLGNGTGIFGAPANFSVAMGPQSIEVADFNLDGNLDFATSNFSANNITVRMGNGAASFSAGTNYSIGTQPRTLKSKDVNNDGDKDILVLSGTGPSNMSVLLGSPSGTFMTPVDYTVTTGAFDLTIADFNGDGNQDAAVCSSSNGIINVLLGSATGTFSTAATYSVGLLLYGIASEDLNNDGKMDLVVTDFNGGVNNLKTLLGNGNGTFATFTSHNPSQSNNFDLATADFDNNGYADIVLTTGTSASNTARVVYNHIVPVISVNSGTICSGQSFVITPSGAATYTVTGGTFTVTPTVPSNYSVTGTSTNGCISTAAAIATVNVLTCTGITEISGNEMPLVYPNPAKEVLNISGQQKINKVEIYDLTGKLILFETVNSGLIDISELHQGLLIIKITLEDNEVIVTKIIKE